MKKFSILLIMLLSYGCAKQTSNALQLSAKTATTAIGCSEFQSKVFDSMYMYLEEQQIIPDLELLKANLYEQIDHIAADQKIQDTQKVQELKNEFSKIFVIMLSEGKKIKNISDAKTHLQLLIELEMQDQSSIENRQLNEKLLNQFTKVTQLVQYLNLDCKDDTDHSSSDDSVSNNKPPNNKSMAIGMKNVFATAYQSCQANEVPEITATTPDVVGIKVLSQMHPDGVGSKRVISNLSSVQQSHPYIKVAGNISDNGCFNVYNHPLIYDYGGEPTVSNNTLNFFKDAGTGTKVLGIDCSSLVSSAAAAGGLRYKPGLANKAVFIRQTSTKFINAASSGFTCYKNITITPQKSIQVGDIAATRGHVVMINRVGPDPFGIKRLSHISECSSIDTNYFDFSVAQSSPSKNGIGINKYIAKDYLNEHEKMKTLFTNMALATCKAYFNGTSSTPKNSAWGIIRHLGTAECLAPKIQMVGQSCVSQCQM